MIDRIIIAGALIAALVAALWWGGEQHERAEAAEAQVVAYQEAARVLSAHMRAAEAEREKWRSVAEELSTLEGRNEDLNPYERAVLDRVRQP